MGESNRYMKQMEVVSGNTLQDAYYNFSEFHGWWKVNKRDFEKFMGCSFHWFTDRFMALPKIAHKLNWLASRHHHALLSAYYARRKKGV